MTITWAKVRNRRLVPNSCKKQYIIINLTKKSDIRLDETIFEGRGALDAKTTVATGEALPRRLRERRRAASARCRALDGTAGAEDDYCAGDDGDQSSERATKTKMSAGGIRPLGGKGRESADSTTPWF